MKDPLEPLGFWRPTSEECAALRDHLLAELPLGHVLGPDAAALKVVARDRDGDRIVVRPGPEGDRVALVQMTWAGRPAMAPFLPETELFDTEAALAASLTERSPA